MILAQSLEAYLSRASKPLRYRIERSLELIRKAEALALTYSEDGFWVGFSGGKDSQALLHLVQLAGVKYKAFFSPTSVDPPEVIRFIRQNYPEVTFTKLKRSIYDVFREKRVLPSMSMRWCCAEFKEQGGAGTVTLVGVRHAESVKRSKRNVIEVSNHKFSGDFEQFEQWSQEQRSKKLRKRKKDAQFDQFSEHQEQMVTCVGGKDKIIISPIIEWLDRDVWEFLNDVLRVPHCCLYDEGQHRIGCILCPMSTTRAQIAQAKRWPYVKDKWIKAIMDVCKECKAKWIYSTVYPKDGSIALSFYDKFSSQIGEGRTAEEVEREIAENIFDWWISKKSYKQWYFDKFANRSLFEGCEGDNQDNPQDHDTEDNQH